MQKDVLLTPEGLDKLKDEIEHLSTDKRREVAERIKEAREFGDISENSEYDDAKNEQAMLEARIASLEEKLRSASVIDASELDSDVVRVGSLVSVKDEGSGKSLKYTIVGSTEANPSENRLSNESPVGKALLGRKKGDTVEVHAAQRQDPRAQDHQDRRRVSDEAAPAVGGGEAEILAARRRKLEELRAAGIDPFPHEFAGVVPIAQAREGHDDLEPGGETETRVRVAGRLAARRGQGKAIFLDLVDRSGRIQLLGPAQRARRGGVRAAARARPRRPDRAPTARSSARAPAS